MIDIDEDLNEDVDYNEPPGEILPGAAGALEHANWRLRHVRRLEQERTTLDHLFQQRIHELETRWRERREVLDRQVDWWVAPVHQLHAALLAEDPSKKTIHLPDGTLKATVPKKPKLRIADQETVLVWAIRHAAEAVQVVSKVLVTDLDRVVDVERTDDGFRVVYRATGEVVPGATAEIPPARYSVDTNTASEMF